MANSPKFKRGNRGRSSIWQGVWFYLRSALVIGALVLAAALWRSWSAGEAEEIALAFPPCDAPGYSANCVVDGDTFRIGSRRIRIEGIDAPERDGACQAERQLAARATAELTEWLGRGPFMMDAEADAPRDTYGRELQRVWRVGEDGRRDDVTRHMKDSGTARAYDSRAAVRWC